MTIKKKFVWLCLSTALVMTLVFINSNVASMGAAGTGNPSTAMTFNSNITMDFGSGKTTWLTNGSIIQFKNITGDATEKMEKGSWFAAWVSSFYGAPLAGHWYYVYYPENLYGMSIAFQVDTVIVAGAYRNFNVSQVYNHFYDAPTNFTIFPPVEAGTYIYAEHMIDPLTVCYGYYVVSGEPTDDSWWEIDYPGDWATSRFHVDDAYLSAGYLYAHIDTLLNGTGADVPNIPADPIPNEGFGGFELIKTIEPGVNYSIFKPAALLPPAGSWWNITYPAELSDIQFNVGSSGEGYFAIDTLWNTTANAAEAQVTLADLEYSVSAVLATAPTVDTIGTCKWFNVIAGATPDPQSWWNITTTDPLNGTLVGTQFYVDTGGDGVFHIDEVLGGDVTGLDLANVTAEELTPAIYVYPDEIIDENLTSGETFTMSIKTNYTLHVWSYEFTLEWNPAVLNVTAVTNMELFAGASFIDGTIDNVNGKLSLTGAKFDYEPPDPATQVYPTPDNCTLANVTFTVVGTGDSYVTLGPKTRLVKFTKEGYGIKQNIVDDVTGEIVDGYFRNYEGAVVHDVAVTNVALQVSEVYPTWTIQVNVTVLNNGTLSETFNVKVYYDQIAPNWLIETQTVLNLGGGANTILTINWNLTDVSLGYRTIKVKATLAFGDDANPADNTLIDGTVLVKIPGDIDGDADVDWMDFSDFAWAFGSKGPPQVPIPEPDYDFWADLDWDGDVDWIDFSDFAWYFGESTTAY